MALSSGVSRGGQSTGSVRKVLVLVLAGLSFLVFVTGSFVFAYLLLASPQITDKQVSKIGDVSLRLPFTSSPEEKAKPVETEAEKRRLSFLLLGVDQRDDERGVPTRSDTMIVVSVDQVKKTATMISLPRDMWVQIPGYADNRINVANFLGDAYHYPGGGPALAEKTVEQNFGLKIDYYARVNFRGFEKLVDTLGGVTVNVENAIRDTEYPTEDYETMTIYIPAGVQHMNGKVALQYARSRHTENDFGRAKRQQRLLMAIRDRAMQLDVLPKLPSLMGTLKNMVDTDIPPSEFLRLARLATEINSSNVGNLVIDEKLARPFKGEGGADLLSPNMPEIRKAIATLFADPVVRNEAPRIELLNGTDRYGLAGRTSDYLMEQGFEVVKVASADRIDYKNSQIVVLGNKKASALLLAETLKLESQAVVSRPAPTSPSSSGTGPDLQVILGQDFKLLP